MFWEYLLNPGYFKRMEMLVSVIRSSYWLPWRGLPSYLVMSWLHLPPVSSLWKVKNSVLVCSSCHIKILQTGWPKLQKFISHTSRSWEAQDQGAIPLSSWWGFSGLQLDHLLATTSREISSVRVGGEGMGGGQRGTRWFSAVSSYTDTDSVGSRPHSFDFT